MNTNIRDGGTLFTSSFTICPKAYCRRGGGGWLTPHPLNTSWSVDRRSKRYSAPWCFLHAEHPPPPFCYSWPNLPRRRYTWRGPYSRTWDHPWLMFFCVRLKVLMLGFLHFLWENFFHVSNSSSPTAFSNKWNPASSGQHREKNNTT